MSAEHRERSLPFRIEVKPLVYGADPYIEPKRLSGGDNPRAVFKERTYLYEGPNQMKLVGTDVVSVQSFVDIERGFFADSTDFSRPFIHWGLKGGITGENMRGFETYDISVDPIEVFRATQILDALPAIRVEGKKTNDFYAALTAAKQVFYDWELTMKEFSDEISNKQQTIATLITPSLYQEILTASPPQLEDMVIALRDKNLTVNPKTLKQDFQRGTIIPSTIYEEAINHHDRLIEGMVEGLRRTGGR